MFLICVVFSSLTKKINASYNKILKNYESFLNQFLKIPTTKYNNYRHKS